MERSQGVRCTISTLLEDEATDTERINGLDIADFLIAELRSLLKFSKSRIPFSAWRKSPLGGKMSEGSGVRSSPKIQSHFSPILQTMICKNKALLTLLNALDLKETNT